MSKATPADTISGDELCEITGLTDRRHRQLATEGYFPSPRKGRYKLHETLAGLFRFFREQLHSKEDSLAVERKAAVHAKRIKLETETAILKGLYVEREQIAPLLRNLALRQRAELKNKLENELPAKLAGQDPLQIQERLARTVDELCSIFKNATAEWVEPPKKK
ncbi:MAG TPA: hypothetical protein VG167_18870 [Verrucomicrobiae bacterium]|nr:hypothetical protein [Verrucomicrobiae bacterium]